MDIMINGAPSGVATAGRTIGQALSEIDERLEAAGAIIVGVRVDGKDIDAEGLAAAAERDASGPGTVELAAESVSDMKTRALETLLELVAAAANATIQSEREAVLATWDSFRSAFGGLFSAEEESFMDAFGEALAGGGSVGLAAARERLASFFGERLAELRDPAGAMRSAGRVFDAIRADLAEVSVRLQTGKDSEAMKTMIVAVELINKTVRILPLFVRGVAGAGSLTIGGKTVADFYAEFNESLRELAGAFESKDGVLIGDLAEYEMLPRLDSFFGSVRALAEAS